MLEQKVVVIRSVHHFFEGWLSTVFLEVGKVPSGCHAGVCASQGAHIKFMVLQLLRQHPQLPHP